MGSYRIYGVSHELDLRSELALFDLGNNQFYRESILELREVSKLYERVEFPEQNEQTQELRTRAKVGGFVANFVAAVEDKQDDDPTTEHEQLFSSLRSLAEKSFISKELQQLLLRLARLSRTRLQHLNKTSGICDDLDTLLASIAHSNVERVMNEFRSIDPQQSTATRFDYKEDKEPREKDRFLVEFEGKLHRVLETQKLGEDEYSMILTKLRDLAYSGWARSSQGIMNQVMAEVESPTLQMEANQLRSQIDWIGKPLIMDDLLDQSKKPANISSGLVDATVILYLPQVNDIRKADAKFMQLVSVYNSMVSSNRIRFVAILVHREQETIYQKIEQLNQQVKPIQFYSLDANSPGGQKFSTAVPLEKLPYFVVLDAINNVVAINPLPQQVVGVVNKLKSSNR